MHVKGSVLHEKKTNFYKERDLEKIPVENRVYIDESGINQYVYREYGRASRIEKVFGEVSGI